MNHYPFVKAKADATLVRYVLARLMLLMSIGTVSNALAQPGYDNQVRTWCAAAGRPAPNASLLGCDACHANKSRFQNLRAAPSNATYLNYFCKAPAAPSNRPPVVKVKSSFSAVEGKLLTFTLTATDPDKNQFLLSATGLPTDASFDPSTGQFSWLPVAGAAAVTAPMTVTFTATDIPTNGTAPLSGSASTTIRVVATASAINNPPVILPIRDKTVAVGKTLKFKVSARDRDRNRVALSASGQPLDLGASFDPTTRIFRWSPSADQVNDASTPYTVSFTATDDASTPASVTEDVNIVVNPASGPEATIRRVIITQARWSNAQGTLSIRGRLGRSRGTVPSGLVVSVSDAATGAVLGSADVSVTGSWSFTGPLPSNASPCSIQADLNGMTASRSVGGSGCGGGSPGDEDGDHEGGEDD